MQITEVRVHKFNTTGNTKAFATITLDNAFVVGGLSVIEGSNGMFVQMPRRKDRDEKYRDTCYPLSRELRQEITEKVLAKYTGDEEYEVIPEISADDLPF